MRWKAIFVLTEAHDDYKKKMWRIYCWITETKLQSDMANILKGVPKLFAISKIEAMESWLALLRSYDTCRL